MKAETTLLENGVELKARINEDGIIKNNTDETLIEQDVNNTVDTDNTCNDDGNSGGKTSGFKPKKTLNVDAETEYTKIGVNIREDLRKKINILGKKSKKTKSNDVVVKLLSELFDGKKFNVKFEAKSKTKLTSFNIPSDMEAAIDKIKQATEIPKSEIFNRLIEEALKDYF